MKIDGSLSPLDISISGLKAQNKNVKAITSNVANSMTSDAGSGEPYRRIEAILKATSDDGIAGVDVDSLAEDMSPFSQILAPGSPNADSEGYVQMPNVNLPVEIINLNAASRAYQANAAVLKRYQSMVNTSLELLR